MSTDEFLAWLKNEENGYLLVAAMPDELWCGVKRLLFHYTLHIGVIGDTQGYDDRYCYATLEGATKGMLEWETRNFQGEPTGWRKHPASERCRNDAGDPESETKGW